METLESNSSAVLQNWRLITSPPLSGRETMRCDVDVLDGVQAGLLPPTLRFFRFKDRTVSYGRLQKWNDISPLVPKGWDIVQRPTGGGIVFHKNDLCVSLAWKDGLAPLPERPQEQYRWIHSIILDALIKENGLRMAACCDVPKAEDPFSTRSCFTNPVGYDLMREQEKIVGGALRCTRRATLYQGSIQMPISLVQEDRLARAFQARLTSGS